MISLFGAQTLWNSWLIMLKLGIYDHEKQNYRVTVVVLLQLMKTEESLAFVFPITHHAKECKIKMMYLHISVPKEEGSLHIRVLGYAPRKWTITYSLCGMQCHMCLSKKLLALKCGSTCTQSNTFVMHDCSALQAVDDSYF